MNPLRIKSQIAKICCGKPPELNDVSIDVQDLPQSAVKTYEHIANEGYKKGGESHSVATLSSFLSLECYFPQDAKKFSPDETAMRHIQRVIDTPVDSLETLSNEAQARRFLLGLNSLVQLSRIPDILTSPPCLSLLALSTDIFSYASRLHGRSTSASDLTIRVVNQTRTLLEQFHEKHSKTLSAEYILAFQHRFYRWEIAITRWTISKDMWREDAEAFYRQMLNSRPDLKGEKRQELRPELSSLRPMLRFYSKSLGIKNIIPEA